MNLDSYIGQAVEVEDPSARNQCMDWAFKVCDLRGISRSAIRNPAAKDVWGHHDATILNQFQDPQPFDFAIWGTGVGPYGHISIVKSGTHNAFTSWDQNWAGKQTVQLVNHTSNGLLGFLRLKGTTTVASPSAAEVKSAAATYGQIFTDAQVAYYAARPWETLINDLLPAVNDLRLAAEKKLAQGGAQGQVLAPGNYTVK